MSLILANTLSNGLRAGLVTMAGTTTGLAVLVGAATVGMSSVMVLMSEWFDAIRWMGALYLVYLGGRQLWQFRQRKNAGLPPPRRSLGANLYFEGLVVSLSNPKVLLFPRCFPAAVRRSDGAIRCWQLSVLAVLFVVVLALVDVCYTLVIGRARLCQFDAARLGFSTVLRACSC